MDKILNADNAVLAEVLLDDGIVGQGNALLVDLAISTLVDELLDALEVGVTVGNPRLDNLDHLSGSLGHTDEDTVVDLEKTEKLEDLARLGGNLVDTLDSDNKDQLLLSRDVEAALLLGDALKADLLTLGITVLLDVLLGTLEDNSTLLLVDLLALLELSGLLSASLLLALALLKEGLRNEDLVLGGNGPIITIRLVHSPQSYMIMHE